MAGCTQGKTETSRDLRAARKQAEVRSLLSHQRRCREAEQLDRDLASQGVKSLKEGARASRELESLRSREKELQKFDRKRIMAKMRPMKKGLDKVDQNIRI